MEILGIIPARGGSKSIPKKSIYPCGGKPLIAYTILAAQKSSHITRLIVSTDDEEIAAVALSFGVEIPFIRPKELAEDLTPDLPVFEHALQTLESDQGYLPDVVVHLRPTTPLKTTEDIDTAIQLLLNNAEAHSVQSVCEPIHTPFKMFRISEEGPFLEPLLKNVYPQVFAQYPEAYSMPRQLLPTVWRHSGYVDVIRPEVIRMMHSMSGSRILPFFFEKWRDVDIDSMDDLKLAEIILERLPRDPAL